MQSLFTVFKNPRALSALIAWLAVIATMLLRWSGHESFLIPIYVMGIIVGSYLFAEEGVEKVIKKKNVSIDLLMTIGIVGAAILGEWNEALLLAALYATSEAVESYTKDKTRTAIRALMDLAPKKALVKRNSKEEVVPADSLKVGDIIIVKPGEAIATDGTIRSGSASINQAAITGESIPVFKQVEDQVFSGTINEDGLLEIEVTKDYQENTISKIIHLVENAQKEKGKKQQIVEKFGNVYSPFVLLAAIGITSIPPLLGGSLSVWFNHAIIFIIGAEPAVLAISVPLAFAAAIGSAGKHGVLIKGGIYLEELASVKAIAFDKTGTLTKGKPVLTDIVPLGDVTHAQLMQIAGSLASNSNHPLNRAIHDHVNEEKTQLMPVSNFQSVTGSGVQGTIESEEFKMGSPNFFTGHGQDVSALSHFKKLSEDGKTVTFVGTSTRLYGLLAILDTPRPEAKEMLSDLSKLGIKSVMLTGDHTLVGQSIGRELGISEVAAELKPTDKVNKIINLKNTYGHVGMVGDGVNDAPALAESSVGMAMGTAGTDAALEAANVALLSDNLLKIPYAIRLARATKTIVTQNLVFSIGLLSVTIILAIFSLTSLSTLLLIHEGGEVLVILNGLRLFRNQSK